jgi:hypothetical protein
MVSSPQDNRPPIVTALASKVNSRLTGQGYLTNNEAELSEISLEQSASSMPDVWQ